LIFFDTDICIDILHGNYSLKSFKQNFLSNEKFAITTPSIFELYMGYYKLEFGKNRLNEMHLKKERRSIQKLIQGLYIFSLDEEAARRSAKIYRHLESIGMSLDLFDCLIASIILANNFSNLMTRNEKHFQRIEGINIIKP